MLHIHNGDSTANTAKLSDLPGEHFAFREALIEGPTPPARDSAEWRAIRARHLSESYAVEFDHCERELADQENKLATFAEHEEIVLWFEHDLFCQTNLLYLLDWFSQHEMGHTRLSQICIDRFPGVTNFRGLGQLDAEQLASLFPDRKEVKRLNLDLARSAWQAYCSPQPTALEDLLETDTSSLPFLAAALRAHLKRFPSARNGLGNIENTVLKLIQSDASDFNDLFSRFADALPEYGFGDAQLWLTLRRLNGAKQRVLKASGLDHDFSESPLTKDVIHNARFEITELGKSVLGGEADFVALNGIDIWLGGVHLEGDKNLWRWDDQSEKIVYKIVSK
jgi:hypothetical protein